MPFNSQRLRQAKWQPRTEEVRVPGLADFFDEGEAPVFRVRSLDGRELARMREEGTEGRQRLLEAAHKIASGEAGAIAEAVAEMGEGESSQTYMHVYLMQAGCVDPTISRQDALILHQHRNTEFNRLANVILRLSGEGSQLGKPKPSGATPASKPPSHSANSGGDSSTSADPTSSPTAT